MFVVVHIFVVDSKISVVVFNVLWLVDKGCSSVQKYEIFVVV